MKAFERKSVYCFLWYLFTCLMYPQLIMVVIYGCIWFYRYFLFPGVFDGCISPTDVSVKVIDPILDQIVYQSNLYAVQRGKILNIDNKELLSFVEINFYMGYNVLPSWRHYWSTSANLGWNLVINTMRELRFDNILSNLHINDNTTRPQNCTDKMYKTRPLIDKLNENFIKIYNVNRHVVHKSMILFNGRSTLKQYNPMKLIKRSFKIWCLGDQSRFTWYTKVNFLYSAQRLSETTIFILVESIWRTRCRR